MTRSALLLVIVLSLLSGLAGGYLMREPSSVSTRTTVVRQTTPGGAPADTAVQVYKQASPGVVFLRATTPEGEATGSGFVVDRKGDILTNAHVVGSARTVEVQLSAGQKLLGKVLSADRSLDVALVRIQAPTRELQPLPLGTLKGVEVGQPVYAIGNPFGLDETLTVGVVSALHRTITSLNGFSVPDAIQTDAAINPGNSGGPLLDSAGKVLGINTQIVTGGGKGSVGIGFAVPIDAVAKQLSRLQAGKTGLYGWLGVTGGELSPQALRRLKLRAGVKVQAVTPGSPAAKAGLKPGQVIVRVDRADVDGPDTLAKLLGALAPGTQVTLHLADGSSLRVTLGDRPQQAPAR